ncbi:MAG TPA: fucose isomerase [Armatimonadota bacterium]|jgi:L-fucose isomerase-like protein
MRLANSPEVKLAIVGVSRDCFPIDLTRRRLHALAEACATRKLPVLPLQTIIEKEADALAALREAAAAGANAAVIYLGNFGPEGPLAIFAQQFPGPVMAIAAAEESKDSLREGRGDAYCGLLNASYNFGLRNVPIYIPQMPVDLPEALAAQVAHFTTVARLVIGVRQLKIFGFGPRPQDFYACNAPIKPFYDLGIEVMENSELDLLVQYNEVSPDDPQVATIAADMAAELGMQGNPYPDLLPKLARFELTLLRFYENNLGSRQFGVFADKCWPAFEKAFGFVPCYVNSRLASRGIPVSCEVDLYGALSEYLCQLASDHPATLLDINNTVPADLLGGADLKGASPADLFMGFHCGNTPGCCTKSCGMSYQFIMHRLMEAPGSEPDFTRGTLEGQLKPGPTTVFRLQGTAEGALTSYIAEGEVLDIDPHSFGSIGIFGIPNFARFYRHVLVGKRYPHHAAIAFTKCGATLFDAVKLLGVRDLNTPLPSHVLYPGENPFA